MSNLRSAELLKMTIKTLPERRGLVEGPFLYAKWWHNYCPRCGLEIGAYYIVHQPYPPRRFCLHCATKQVSQDTDGEQA